MQIGTGRLTGKKPFSQFGRYEKEFFILFRAEKQIFPKNTFFISRRRFTFRDINAII